MMNACGMHSSFRESKRPLIRLVASPLAAFTPHAGRRKGVV
jgi:hypothetical protein